MDRTVRQKRRRGVGILRAVRSGVFGCLVMLIIGIVGGLECGIMPTGVGLWTLVLCGVALVLCGVTR